jgi:PST family polysaccharide transporter
MKEYLAHPIMRNVMSLYAMQWAGYIIPLMVLPYIARVLQPQGFGLLLFSQSFALWTSMFIEYGFNLSATRDIAQSRGDRCAQAQIAASVLGAKLLLLGSVLVISATAAFCVPVFRAHPIYLLCALPQILAGGFSPFWYFQGTERMARAISIEFFSRALFTSLIFFAVRHSSDGWTVLLLQGCAGASSTIVTTCMMYREVAFERPQRLRSWKVLRDGWGMFLFRGSYSIFTTANTFILGLISSPLQVGLYGGGERIARAMQGQIGPVTQAFYPHISHMFSENEAGAKRMARWVIGASGGVGLLLGIVLAFLAIPLTRLLLGPGYGGSVNVVRVFCVLLPISALNNGIIMQWMLPSRMDNAATAAILGAIAVNVAVAVLLAPRFAHLGMAFAVLAGESFMLAAIIACIMRNGLSSRAVNRKISHHLAGQV